VSFWQFLQANWPELLLLVRQHIVLVFVAILVAVIIGVPVGILLTRYRSLRGPVLGIANVMQTIPSLALFGFLIPLPFIGGIGTRTALVALVVYSLLPIIRNTVTGILNVDPNVRDNLGYTALAHAVEANYSDVEDALLNYPGLDPNVGGLKGRPVLLAYVWRDDKERTEKLLAHGANANVQDADGDTPLHGAAQNDNVEIARLLLDKGANPNAKNKLGGTPLMYAGSFGSDNAARFLLSRGADPSLKDNDGVTAAKWAELNNRKSTAVILKGKR